MKLQLNPQTKVGDIKREFSAFFPNLKIEFFKKMHGIQKGSYAEDKLSGEILLTEINPGIKNKFQKQVRNSFILIDPLETVSQLEQMFQNSFGLPVQVFRRSGNIWIETIQTDHLTLMKQNQMGYESLSPARFNAFTLFL